MNILQSLQSISLYPVPRIVCENIATECGISADDEVTQDTYLTHEYKKAKAKVYEYLADSPSVTEGGATYNFSDEERKVFRRKAAALLDEIGENVLSEVDCGYFGEDF